MSREQQVSEQRAEPEASGTESLARWRRLQRRLHANRVTALATKVVVGIVGVAVILAGVVMMVAPGPAIVVIPLGLAILALEFPWAEKLLTKARDKARAAREKQAAKSSAQKRRELALQVGTVVLVVGAVALYVVAFDWPGWTVRTWDYAQSTVTFLPELPGM